MTKTVPESKKYGEMLAEVEGIIGGMQGEEVDLDEMISKIERGYQLIKAMRERLGEARQRVETLRQTYEEPTV